MTAILSICLFVLIVVAGLIAHTGFKAFMYEEYFGFTACLIFFLLCIALIWAVIILLL